PRLRGPFLFRKRSQDNQLAAIQSRLGSEDGLLEYFWGEKQLYAFGIDQEGIRVHHIPLTKHLVDSLKAWRSFISSSGLAEQNAYSASAIQTFSQQAHYFYQLLVQPLFDQLPTRLRLAKDGLLGIIPFDILLTSEANESHYGQLPYLLRSSVLRTVYSGEWLLGDFVPNASADELYGGFAPQYAFANSSASSQAASRGIRSVQFTDLRHNRSEVASVAQLLDGSATLGREATEISFKSSADHYRILHLAMHAYTDDERPAFSGLVFSPADTLQEDGFLHAYEIAQMPLNAELAVLSACNTGNGQLRPGEGVMSLARAFSLAGCPRVVMSLWAADDVTTNQLMDAFFDKIKAGKSVDEALQQAKLQYLAESDLNHPYYWSAFVMLGEKGAVSNKGGLHYWLVGGLLLLLVGIGVWAKRRRIS
ncbi:MAG: CHAT domain-containing protein, partial [Bacteroidota bacterium]